MSGITVGIIFFLIFASYTLAIWFGSKLIYEREYNSNTGKTFAAGDILTVLFTIVFGAFSLGQAAPNIKAITEAMNAAYDFFELKKRIPNIRKDGTLKPDKEKIEGRIEFKNVIFSYPSMPNKLILDGVNIIMKSGTTNAIVGPSGGGKSTIVNLVERLYEVTGGQIMLDGYDIGTLDVNYLRSLIGYVPQEPVLFNTTIRDNIIFGREGISDEQVWGACKKAYADEFIKLNEDGIDYVVGIKGSKLSGGQKQRIAIARAILTQPKILILDEATSALDNRSEKEVQKALNKVSEGLTTIIIAHRLSTIMNADKIVVLNDSKIQEEGNHKSLMELNGLYANLIQSQVANIDNIELKETEGNNQEIPKSMALGVQTDGNGEIQNINANREEIPRTRIKRKSSFEQLQDRIAEENRIKSDKEKLADDKRKKLWPIICQNAPTLVFSAIAASCAGAVWPAYGILLADSINSLSKPDMEAVKNEGFMLSMYFLILAGCAGLSVFFQK
jgi:ATP-binding cassette subfamily B (MDR/TAP) protein 1